MAVDEVGRFGGTVGSAPRAENDPSGKALEVHAVGADQLCRPNVGVPSMAVVIEATVAAQHCRRAGAARPLTAKHHGVQHAEHRCGVAVVVSTWGGWRLALQRFQRTCGARSAKTKPRLQSKQRKRMLPLR